MDDRKGRPYPIRWSAPLLGRDWEDEPCLVYVYRRESNWRPYHYQSGDLVELTSIGVSFPFDAVYRRIV